MIVLTFELKKKFISLNRKQKIKIQKHFSFFIKLYTQKKKKE